MEDDRPVLKCTHFKGKVDNKEEFYEFLGSYPYELLFLGGVEKYRTVVMFKILWCRLAIKNPCLLNLMERNRPKKRVKKTEILDVPRWIQIFAYQISTLNVLDLYK